MKFAIVHCLAFLLCLSTLCADAQDLEPVFEETFDGPVDPKMWTKNEDANIEESTLRVSYVPDERGSPRLSYYQPLPPAAANTLTYDLLFEPDFEFVKGGKLPGFAGGSTNRTKKAANGCIQPQPADTWSFRLMWRREGQLQMYIYDQSRLDEGASRCGVTNNADWYFGIGQWYTIGLYVQMNSRADRTDGVAEVYVDGVRQIQRTNIQFASWEGANQIDQLFFSTFYGGSNSDWAPSKTTHARFDNFRVYPGKLYVEE